MENADKDRLRRAVKKSISKVFKDSLSLIEAVGLDEKQYSNVRKLILRSGNDEIRKMNDELEKYEVNYTPRYDEQVDFHRDQ